MVASTTRDEQRAQTRSDLLRAAARVFARNGYNGTSVDMVAEAAGYTKGAVYSNFDSKEALFLKLWEDQVANQVRDVAALVAAHAPEDRATAIATARAHDGEADERFLLELEFTLFAARNPEVRSQLADQARTARARLAEIAREHFADAGILHRLSPSEVAALAVAVDDGLRLMRLLDPTLDTTQLSAKMLEVLLTTELASD